MQIAKALVLGTQAPNARPWPTIGSVPKPLVPVANRPIVFHHLDALRQAGMLEAAIAAEPESLAAIRSAVGSGERWGLRIAYVESSESLTLEDALVMTRDFVVDEPVLVQRVGALLCERIQPHVAAFAGERLDALALRLTRAADSRGGDAFDGGCMLSERAVSILGQGRASAADALSRVREEGGHVRSQDVDGCLPCDGGEDALLEANRRMLEMIQTDVDPSSLQGSTLEGPVIAHPTSRIEDSLVRGPAIIGPHTHVKRSYVGPYTSIGPGVSIEGSEVEHSIVFAGAELSFVGMRLETSIIGPRACVTRSFAVPRALRLSIGEGAEVAVS